MGVTNVVFDFDGTLVDSRAVAIRIYNTIAEREGYALLKAEQLEELRGLSLRERCTRMGVSPLRLPGLVTRVLKDYRGVVHELALHEGIVEVLQRLRERGLRLSILSTNDEANIRAVLERHGLADWVAGIHSSNRVFGKARLLRGLMKRDGLSREELVYVGDECRDVEACKEAGVRVIAVRWGYDAPALLERAGPDALVEHPAELPACLERLAA
ncbi:HAD hydrolase-like protein [Archangium primigenium]|uniref:HAD hydrolase-like protein n=1 Tax=[Archangium] primigenium TaxID=2792470 RepID=UPI0030842FB7